MNMFARKLLRFADFRRQPREAQSDLMGSVMVAEAVATALSDLEVAIVGLGRRVENLRAWIGGLLGSDGCDPCWRHVDAEADLADAERQLLSGLARLTLLKAVRVNFAAMQVDVASERNRALEACRSEH